MATDKVTPCMIVIFGASGDLTKRKLLPALLDLYQKQLLPEHFAIVGIGRTAYSDESFREYAATELPRYSERTPGAEALAPFIPHLYYVTLDPAQSEAYPALGERLQAIDAEAGTQGNYLYYLSTPPKLYGPVAQALGQAGLAAETQGWRRLIIEKPFGYDLASAQALNQAVKDAFHENQIYRIDHYLGKETVQNVMVFRFANGLFEPLWNQKYIDRVEITAAESLGVEGRGGYYDGSGALRDMLQNHMLQLLGMVAMEPPATFDAQSIRNETLKVFQSLRPMTPEQVPDYVVRGQYTAATVKGERHAGYREESGVAPDSRTETFVAMRMYLDNWRWGGVPFYLRTGKGLPTRATEVVIHFKPTPHRLFARQGDFEHNQLILRIQPDEGILLKFGMKLPGAGFEVKNVNMDFHYSDLRDVYLPSAYERLLLDALMGDATLYTRGDAVEACWAFVAPILKAWELDGHNRLYGYPVGTWGPLEADGLMGPEETWRYPCANLAEDGIFCEL